MFARAYFAGRMFAPRYFAQSQGQAPPSPTFSFYLARHHRRAGYVARRAGRIP